MPVQIVQSTVASAAATLVGIPLNVHLDDAPVQWSVNKSGNGTFTGNVQYTLDKILDADVSALWITDTAVANSSAATMNHPASGIRLQISAASGNNQIGFRVLQTGD